MDVLDSSDQSSTLVKLHGCTWFWQDRINVAESISSVNVANNLSDIDTEFYDSKFASQ